jgi:hypothetical protein
MGYTQYWKIRKSFTDAAWTSFTNDVKSLFASTKIPLAGAFGTTGTTPEVNHGVVSFNGVEDDSHETCQITKSACDFEFCKTAHKPYDAVVVAVLKLARKYNPSTELSSDGEGVFD